MEAPPRRAAVALLIAQLVAAPQQRAQAQQRGTVRLYPAPLSPENHPLRDTKATRPPELQLFGSGSACANVSHGCTGFGVQMYTSSNSTSGDILGNTTDQLLAVRSLGNLLSPSQMPL